MEAIKYIVYIIFITCSKAEMWNPLSEMDTLPRDMPKPGSSRYLIFARNPF